MRRKNLALRVLSTAAFLSIVTSCAAPAFADAYGIATYGNYYLDQGNIVVDYQGKDEKTGKDVYKVTQGENETTDTDGWVTISNSKQEGASDSDDPNYTPGSVKNPGPTKNTITITNNVDGSKAYTGDDRASAIKENPNKDTSAKITLDNVNIDATGTGKAGVAVKGTGDVTIEINNTDHSKDGFQNTIKGDTGHAGIEKNDGEDGSSGTLVLVDDHNQGTGELNVIGGAGAAGIGSAAGKNTSNIIIDNGQITAKGGDGANGGGAGIGSGAGGKAESIIINNGTFNVTGGNGTGGNADGGAGIGSGAGGSSENINAERGTFNNVTGGEGVNGGAGIGSGGGGTNTSTTISNGDLNHVVGGAGSANGGAGIGSGGNGTNTSTIIKNGTFNSVTGGKGGTNGGAGFGSGGNSASSSTEVRGGVYNGSITGGAGANGGAGIGSGGNASVSNVTITGTANGTGADGGAGIGSGANSKNSTVTITDGKDIIGNGGAGAAGIGSGRDASGSSEVKIEGWNIDVTGNGGEGGAGIGSGKDSTGSSSITINGENPRGERYNHYNEDGTPKKDSGLSDWGVDVKANGGSGAAGIGGGQNSAGGTITISGGKVEAEGGDGAYAIGSGKDASGSTVTIAGTYNNIAWGALDVTATAKTNRTKAGAVIEGGENLTHGALDNIHRTIVRFVNSNGWFRTLHNEKYAGYYADDHEDITHEDGSQHLWQVTDRKDPTEGQNGYIHYACQIDHCDEFDIILPALPYSDETDQQQKNKAPWLYVADADKKAAEYEASYVDGTAVYRTELDDAVLTGNFAALAQLQQSGIDTVTFVTGQRTSSFRLDALDLSNEESVFALTHTGTDAVLTVDGQSVSLLY